MRQASERAWAELDDAHKLGVTTGPLTDPEAVDDLVNEIRKIFSRSRLVRGWSELPRRQQQIAKYVARGLTSKQIAADIGRNSRDIDAYIVQLMSRTGSIDKGQLRLWIAEHRPGRLGLVNPTGKDPDVDG